MIAGTFSTDMKIKRLGFNPYGLKTRHPGVGGKLKISDLEDFAG